ncbi:MAG: hypothetical protein AB2421_18120, partial [Thermotaleaceae bacterium]
EVLGLFSENKSRAIILFKKFSNEESLDNFVDIKEDDEKLNEEEVFEYIRKYLNEKKIKLEQLNEKAYRIELEVLIKELISKSDLSLRRIAEITGVNREKVRKMNMSQEPSL